jgi:hypothetical protein
MPIPLFILQRIQTAAFDGPKIADALVKIAQLADAQDAPECAVNLGFVMDTDRLIPGDLIPVVTFSLERQQVVQEPVDPDNVIDALSDNKPPFSPAEAALDPEELL